MRRLISLIIVAGLALSLPLLASAQTASVRGKVKTLVGQTLVVQPQKGPPITVTLTPEWGLVVMKPVDVSTIQPGSFIGTTNMDRPDGTGRSLEVHVFPPGVKMGEGHYPWDLKPHSMMTNGTIGKVTAGHHGRMLEVAYPGGTRQILVPPNVPVVGFSPGPRTLLKPGVSVFILGHKLPDGTLGTGNVSIGENGTAPPM